MLGFETQCSCGTNIFVEVETTCKSLRVRCNNCNRLLINFQIASSTSANEVKEATPNTDSVIAKNITEISPPEVPDSIPKLKAVDFREKINDYVLLKYLGQGNMGKVYLASRENEEKKFAIKILQETENQTILDYFLREAQILLQLKHKNIISIEDHGNHEGKPYIVMEYISGGTLHEIIEQKLPNSVHAGKIIYHILRALEHAWHFHIIHRDIKPSNVFVGFTGEVKVIDMGLAKIIDDTYNITQTGQILGTPYYMPPEQILNAKEVKHGSDVYAVGATLYHTLCGKPPYSEYGSNIRELFQAKKKNNYLRLAQRISNLPPEIIKITEKAMAHREDDRYPSAREMREDISNFCKMYSS